MPGVTAVPAGQVVGRGWRGGEGRGKERERKEM